MRIPECKKISHKKAVIITCIDYYISSKSTNYDCFELKRFHFSDKAKKKVLWVYLPDE